jgi:hypothetical protein
MSGVRRAAIFHFPERCGIGITDFVGDVNVPFDKVEHMPAGPKPTPISVFGRFQWKDRWVSMLDLGGSLGKALGIEEVQSEK